MFSTNLTTHFGKIFANVLREYILLDGIVGRDALHIRASCLKCCANNDKNGDMSSLPNKKCNDFGNVALNSSRGNEKCINDTFAAQSFVELQNQAKKNEQICTIYGKSETALPSSSFKLANVWTTSLPQLETKILNQQSMPERNEKAQKQFLNATTNLADLHVKPTKTIATSPTKSFLRAMSMLAARPVQITPKQLEGPTFNVSRRWFSPKIRNRDNCAEWCGEDTCNLNRIQTNTRKSMWVTSDCYKRCPKPFRYDVVFMPGSNKETREYQQTWIECPPIRIVKKPVCCFEPLCLPPICRRPRKPRVELPPGSNQHMTCGVNTCKIDNDPRCIKIREPCCREKARDKPCCIVYPTPACCQKRCTPYPSFSECCKPEPNRKAPIECLCLVKPTMCEVWADWRKKNLPGQYEDL